MGSLFEMVKKLLGSGGSGSGGMGSMLGGMGGSGGMGGGASGGMSMGSMLGSMSGGGASTAASDHAMGLSAGPDGRHYKDMSQPNPNMPMGLLAQLNAMNNAGGPRTQFMPQNALVQRILANYRGY